MVNNSSQKLKPYSEFKWILLLGIIVIIANLGIYWLNILIEDDYYYGIYRWQEIGSTPNIWRETFGFINSSLCWIAGNVNAYLARSIVLFGIVVPCAILVFRILRKLNYPLPVAFFTASMIWFFPGQTEIPLFVNGSYTAEAMLVMLVSFWCGLKFLENVERDKWAWYLAALITQYWALNISELVVPSTVAIVFCYISWGRFRGKAWLLSVPVILLSALHLYFKILHGGRGIITQSHPLTYRTFGNVLLSFVDWSLPATLSSYIDDHMWFKFAVFIFLFVVYVIVVITKTVENRHAGTSTLPYRPGNDEFLWRALFPLSLFFLPLFVMAIAPWFHPRHAIFSAMGFYLFLSYLFFCCLKLNKKIITVIMAIFLLTSMVKHYSMIGDKYSHANDETRQFIEFSRTKHFPARAQIVVVNMDVATCGYGIWSSGYLQYALKRSDVSGLVGREFNLINPFRKHEYSAGGMNGLNIREPLFLYRKHGADFDQLTHLLQWNGDTLNSDYVIYRVDPVNGNIMRINEGKGWLSYLNYCRILAAHGIGRSDILWGGEPTEFDRKRFTGL